MLFSEMLLAEDDRTMLPGRTLMRKAFKGCGKRAYQTKIGSVSLQDVYTLLL